ncbi:MAG TPA: Glu/Leu/Phe/Val dehydrogenase dimerization domain-containing protein [Solirubrobacteraceae bacterium]|nr:Glu/Leu/Phe/Val dehydrogenase dimerization domain-containing protein [Solirubrobacteraceae bacterium]
MVAIHSTVRGPALGGCRLWSYRDAQEAIDDVLRLSQAMTLKASVAGLRLGGGKGVIAAPIGGLPHGALRRLALEDFAELVQSLGGRYVTAEDVGTATRDMTLVARHTRHVAGLPRRMGGSGDPSPFTALGVMAAIQAASEAVFGTASLSGRRISVLGLGHVGSRLARRLASAGARLIVSDVDERRRALADSLGADWMAPDRAWRARVDVLAPCALGGLLSAETVPRLRCRVIAGAANNQLAGEGVAELLHERGILWVPDFVANAGGLINIGEEAGGYDPAAARRRVAGIADTVRELLAEAQSAGCTPLVAALERARAGLAAAAGPGARAESSAAAGRGTHGEPPAAVGQGALGEPPAAAGPGRASSPQPRWASGLG